MDTIELLYTTAPDPLTNVGLCGDDPAAAVCDDDGGVGLCSRASLVAGAAGTVWVRVVDYLDDGTGDYTLTLTVTAGGGVDGCDDGAELEPNDSVAQARPVCDGSAIDGQISPVGDDDYYAVALAAGQTLTAETTDGLGSCAMDTILVLYDGLANPLAAVSYCGDDAAELVCDDDGGNGLRSLLPYAAPAAGTYVLRVVEYADDASGDYVLAIGVN